MLGCPLGKTLRLHAPCMCVCQCVSQSVKLLVHAFCGVHIFLTQRQIGFVCGVFMPCNVENKMRVGMLGQRSLRGSCRMKH